MRSAKSINSLSNSQQVAKSSTTNNDAGHPTTTSTNSNNNAPTSPICRCRVMYLGSSVPHITKDGLQGIQEPLRELYPDQATLNSGNAGIDSWLSVWSNGILIENVDETGQEVKRFFKIDALHYCAAVKFVSLQHQQQLNPYTTLPNGGLSALPKFLPLDSPHARQESNSNPPIFASILRRTTGIKVLECHAFICKREAAANALVRCCFHAYADTMYAKQIGADVNGVRTNPDINNNSNHSTTHIINKQQAADEFKNNDCSMQPTASRRSKSIAALNEAEQKRSDTWRCNGISSSQHQQDHGGPYEQHDRDCNAMIRRKSMNEHYVLDSDNGSDNNIYQNQVQNDKLRKQHKLSKSMHHLNQPNDQSFVNQMMMINDHKGFHMNQSTSAWCVNAPNGRSSIQQVPQQPFYTPHASRVPSYPRQNLIDASAASANNGGTLRSIRSMAANSIASTLLRSKKHAKAMSMAQLNQDKMPISFHQPHLNAAATIGRQMMMPPVPPMFLPNLPPHSIINGSQTMKAPTSRPMIATTGPPVNFEAMTPKEMKKLLKKSAKYGIDPSKFGENGLPLLPLRPPPIAQMQQPCHIPPHSKSGTMVSQSMFSDIYGNDLPDMASLHGGTMSTSRGFMPPELLDQSQMKPILVKPNPEFLKSKAGKKWLKQQKEFKKLLPPHLDGLPIVFGPPPVDPMMPPPPPLNNTKGIQPQTFIPPQLGVPMMDSSGYYNPHPFYGQNGRASATSTLLRYSPHSQNMHDNTNAINGAHHDTDYSQRNRIIYSNNIVGGSSSLNSSQREYDNAGMMIGADGHERQFSDHGQRHHQRRNHMVEQSVISLGDENDFESDEDDRHTDYYDSGSRGQLENHSRRSKNNSHSDDRNNEHITDNYQEKRDFNQQQAYQQVMSPNDDQISYSSGIYKRGHINERAFSYSIRQEHKSGGGVNSDNEYATRNEGLSDNDQQHSSNPYQTNKLDLSNEYYHHNNEAQTLPVNQLTARLESQLNMKSFANSRIKSHM